MMNKSLTVYKEEMIMKKRILGIGLLGALALGMTGCGTTTTTTDGTTQSGGSGMLVMVIWIVAMIALLYFMMIRPQRKEQKKMTAMLADMAVGDSVVTTSGFYGVVLDITDEDVIVEFGNNKNCRIPMRKAAIAQVEKAQIVTDNAAKADATEEKK